MTLYLYKIDFERTLEFVPFVLSAWMFKIRNSKSTVAIIIDDFRLSSNLPSCTTRVRIYKYNMGDLHILKNF